VKAKARLYIAVAMATSGVGLAAAAIALGTPDSATSVRKGGTFRVSFLAGALDYVDPARKQAGTCSTPPARS
jgi:hypothetical protein